MRIRKVWRILPSGDALWNCSWNLASFLFLFCCFSLKQQGLRPIGQEFRKLLKIPPNLLGQRAPWNWAHIAGILKPVFSVLLGPQSHQLSRFSLEDILCKASPWNWVGSGSQRTCWRTASEQNLLHKGKMYLPYNCLKKFPLAFSPLPLAIHFALLRVPFTERDVLPQSLFVDISLWDDL